MLHFDFFFTTIHALRFILHFDIFTSFWTDRNVSKCNFGRSEWYEVRKRLHVSKCMPAEIFRARRQVKISKAKASRVGRNIRAGSIWKRIWDDVERSWVVISLWTAITLYRGVWILRTSFVPRKIALTWSTVCDEFTHLESVIYI